MFLNVTEIESALLLLETNYPSLITRIKLPHETREGRTTHAVKIANGSGPNRVGICLIGGLHGNEWEQPDGLINFIEVLVNAYQTNSNITIGRNVFSATEIQTLIRKVDIFVFPLVNPDGRNHSQTPRIPITWRKNRRDNGDGTFGVDINRNFNFLWNFPLYYSSSAIISASLNTDSFTYIGPEANSEPETRNVIHLLDTYTNIQYFIDAHSSGELLLYNWGNDESQTTTPSKNFANFKHHGEIGVIGDAYKEYVTPSDNRVSVRLCEAMQDSISKVRDRNYNIQSSVDLYVTSGTSIDYAKSRSTVNANLSKIQAFTPEFGRGVFHRDLPEREAVINEITACLLRFSFDVCGLPTSTELLINQIIIRVEVGNDGIRGQDFAGTSHLLGDLRYNVRGNSRLDVIELNNIGTRTNRNWRGWGTGNHTKVYDLINPVPVNDLQSLALYMPAAGGAAGDNADINQVTIQAVSVDNRICDIGSINSPMRFTGNNVRRFIFFRGCL